MNTSLQSHMQPTDKAKRAATTASHVATTLLAWMPSTMNMSGTWPAHMIVKKEAISTKVEMVRTRKERYRAPAGCKGRQAGGGAVGGMEVAAAASGTL